MLSNSGNYLIFYGKIVDQKHDVMRICKIFGEVLDIIIIILKQGD
jgi:hypothetical protein